MKLVHGELALSFRDLFIYKEAHRAIFTLIKPSIELRGCKFKVVDSTTLYKKPFRAKDWAKVDYEEYPKLSLYYYKIHSQEEESQSLSNILKEAKLGDMLISAVTYDIYTVAEAGLIKSMYDAEEHASPNLKELTGYWILVN